MYGIFMWKQKFFDADMIDDSISDNLHLQKNVRQHYIEEGLNAEALMLTVQAVQLLWGLWVGGPVGWGACREHSKHSSNMVLIFWGVKQLVTIFNKIMGKLYIISKNILKKNKKTIKNCSIK